MAELPLDQAVPRFKANEDRLDTFVNSATGYTTSGGTSVQSIQQFLASIGSNGIDFVDNAKARFGTGNDLEIYHSGSGSFIRDTGTGDLTIDGSAISIQTASAERISVSASGINVTGTVEFDGLSGTGAVTITDIADEDNMSSNSATKLATQQSIKAYVDAQVGTADTLSEVLGLGNITGGTDIAVSANDDITFTDSSKAKFGAGSDLQIYHDGSNSYIKEVGTGNLFIDATTLYVSSDIGIGRVAGAYTFTEVNGGNERAGMHSNASNELIFKTGVATERMKLTSSGIDVTGTVEFDGLSGTGSVTVTDILDEDDMTSDSATALATQQSIKAYVDANAGGSGLPTTGGTMTGDILFNDSIKAKYGTSSDLQIFHDGSDSYITESGTGILFLRSNQLKIQSDDGLETYGVFTDNGSVQLYHNNVERLETNSVGVSVTGVLDIFDNNSDISPDGSGSGQLKIDGNGYRAAIALDADGVNLYSTSASRPLIFGVNETEVARVTSTGIGVGTSSPSYKIDVRGDSNTNVGIQVKASGTGDVDAELRLDAADTGESLVRYARDGTTRAVSEYTNSNEWNFTTYNNDKIDFQPNSTNAFRITDTNVYSYKTFNAQDDIKLPDNSQIKIGTGDDLLMYQDGTASIIKHNTTGQLFFMGDDIRFVNQANNNAIMYLIGDVVKFYGNSTRPDNTYSQFGASNDLQIYHDGSNSYVRDVGTGDLYIDTNSGIHLYANGSENMLYAVPNAGVQIFYNNVKKLETTSTGIDVTGNIDISGAGTRRIDISNTTLADTGEMATLQWDNNANLTIQGRTSAGGFAANWYSIQTSDTDGRADAHIFYTDASTERMRIDSGGIDVTGDLLVSSTIEVGSLTPNQDGAIEVGVIALGTPAISSTTDSTSLRNHIIFDNPNGAVGKINTLNSSTSYLTSSDYRLKTDVQEMTGSIDRVKALRPVNFEWVVDGTRVDGFLAHEAQEVVPEAVDGEKDAMRDQEYVVSEATGDIYTPAVKATYETIQVELTPAVDATYDDEGNELTPAVDATYEEQKQELTPAIDEVIHSSDVVEPDELEEGQRWRETTEKVMATRQVPDYQGIDQSKIVPLLTSALQDAIAKIEALETRLEALEA